jgi:hypothetical protein
METVYKTLAALGLQFSITPARKLKQAAWMLLNDPVKTEI